MSPSDGSQGPSERKRWVGGGGIQAANVSLAEPGSSAPQSRNLVSIQFGGCLWDSVMACAAVVAQANETGRETGNWQLVVWEFRDTLLEMCILKFSIL